MSNQDSRDSTQDTPAASAVDATPPGEPCQDAEGRALAMVNMLAEYICRWRPDGTLTFVNDAYHRRFGPSNPNMVGTSFLPLIPEQDKAALLDALATITPDRPAAIVEHRDIIADGSVRWHRWTNRAIFDASGRVEEYLSVGTDITELRRSEEELRASVHRFQTLAQLPPVAIFQTDEHGRNTYVNQHWVKLTGLTADQGRGSLWRAGIHPDDVDRVNEAFWHAFETGSDFAAEYRFLRPDDSVVWVIGSAKILRDERGRRLGCLGAVSDITAIKAAEARVREGMAHQQEMARRERALRRELDHRVRNNLASLLGLVRLYRRSSSPEAMAQVEGKLRAMSEVHDMIAASEGRDVEVAQLVRRLAGLMLGRDAARRVRVQSSEGAIASARASALAMIVQELFTNSLKHGAMRRFEHIDMADPEAPAPPVAEGPDSIDAPNDPLHPDLPPAIDIQWAPRTDRDGFTLSWRELGVPTGPRQGEGMGLSLIEGLARSELEGWCRFAFQPDGLLFELHAGIALYTRDSGDKRLSAAGAPPESGRSR